jgi:hypothetical protein
MIKDVWFMLSVEDRFSFIENNVQINTSKGKKIPLKLVEFQRKWLLDGPLFIDFSKLEKYHNRICLKCRNAGASYILIGLEAVFTCWLYDNIFIPFVSTKEKQSIDLLKYCKKVLNDCEFDIPLEKDLDKQSSLMIKFKNGSCIQSFPGGNPAGIRGPRAMVSYLDEYAYVENQQDVLNSIEYFHSEGGMVSILSTPFGKTNLYWKIWSDTETYAPDSWHRHDVRLFKDMSRFDVTQNLHSQVVKYKLELNCPWLSLDFLEKKRAQDLPFNFANFLQETCGMPLSEITAAISEEVMDTVKMEEYSVLHRGDKPEDLLRTFVMLMDFGAENNVTACVMFEAMKGRLVACHSESIRGTYPEQYDKIRSLFNRYKPNYFLGDATGMGGKNYMSAINQDFGSTLFMSNGKIIGVDYSKKDLAEADGVNDNNKNHMIHKSIRLFSEGRIVIPKNHKELREEITHLEKFVYDGYIKYSGKKSSVGKDDLAMAALSVSLVYDLIFSRDDGDKTDSVENQIRKESNQPLIRKVKDFAECGSVSSNLTRDRIVGFSKLI